MFQRLKTRKFRVLQGYVANYAENLHQRRFTTSYVFTVAECVISWKAELQNTIAFSTTKKEYMAAVETSKEALWLRRSVSYRIQFGFIATARVLFISLKITGITSGEAHSCEISQDTSVGRG